MHTKTTRWIGRAQVEAKKNWMKTEMCKGGNKTQTMNTMYNKHLKMDNTSLILSHVVYRN